MERALISRVLDGAQYGLAPSLLLASTVEDLWPEARVFSKALTCERMSVCMCVEGGQYDDSVPCVKGYDIWARCLK